MGTRHAQLAGFGSFRIFHHGCGQSFDLSGFKAGWLPVRWPRRCCLRFRGDGAVVVVCLLRGGAVLALSGFRAALCARCWYWVLAGNRRPKMPRSLASGIGIGRRCRRCSCRCLGLCADAGLVRVGLLALDGDESAGRASSFQNYDRVRLEKVIGEIEKQLQRLVAHESGV